MKFRNVAIDFETDAITDRPMYPPVPAGVAIKDGNYAEYLAWGHPTKNNCTLKDATNKLAALFSNHDVRCIFHNCAFDIDVAMVHMGLPMPKNYHDTQFLAYLNNPHEPKLGLKPLAERYLGMPPEEQMDLNMWIRENVYMDLGDVEGMHISKAPGKLVGVYAIGDVDRTLKLFNKFHPSVCKRGMLNAYKTELDIVRVKLHMERKGIFVDMDKLETTIGVFTEALQDSLQDLKDLLGIDAEQNKTYSKYGYQHTDEHLYRALSENGHVKQFIYTKPTKYNPEGLPSTKITNLQKTCKNKELVKQIGIHNLLKQYHWTYLTKWQTKAIPSYGQLYPKVNHVRSSDTIGSEVSVGTRTGRLTSSSPNFTNIPRSIDAGEPLYRQPMDTHAASTNSLYNATQYLKTYGLDFKGLRDLVVPDEGHVFLNRDYDQQEFRLLAHFEQGELLDRYRKNPSMDIHQDTRDIIQAKYGKDLSREYVKKTIFTIIYGGSDDAVANTLDIHLVLASKIRDMVIKSLPDVNKLNKQLQTQARAGDLITTLGGRLYDAEIDEATGRAITYKMLNLLIQGSAADVTKQAMVRVFDAVGDVRLQVYDEIMCCVPKEGWQKKMVLMQEAMESVDDIEIPMSTTGYVSEHSWAGLVETVTGNEQ